MLKVLIVEDEDLIRKGLRYIVDWQSAGCTVVGEAANGRDGLKMIAELKPDIVLTDVKMPGMDGLEMLAVSIAQSGYKAVIISGYDEFSYAQKAVSLGVTEYLLKPVDFDLLYAVLRRIVGDHDAAGARPHKPESAALPLRPAPTENRYVRIMLDYIEKNYDQRISLMDVSAEQGVSCAYLNAKFKAETGYPFNDYLNRFRISQAVQLLHAGPELKIYEIAESVGFTDYKYFIKVFKKYTGYSPGRFHGPDAAGAIHHEE